MLNVAPYHDEQSEFVLCSLKEFLLSAQISATPDYLKTKLNVYHFILIWLFLFRIKCDTKVSFRVNLNFCSVKWFVFSALVLTLELCEVRSFDRTKRRTFSHQEPQGPEPRVQSSVQTCRSDSVSVLVLGHGSVMVQQHLLPSGTRFLQDVCVLSQRWHKICFNEDRTGSEQLWTDPFWVQRLCLRLKLRIKTELKGFRTLFLVLMNKWWI